MTSSNLYSNCSLKNQESNKFKKALIFIIYLAALNLKSITIHLVSPTKGPLSVKNRAEQLTNQTNQLPKS